MILWVRNMSWVVLVLDSILQLQEAMHSLVEWLNMASGAPLAICVSCDLAHPDWRSFPGSWSLASFDSNPKMYGWGLKDIG
jgi:hypothetical protein